MTRDERSVIEQFQPLTRACSLIAHGALKKIAQSYCRLLARDDELYMRVSRSNPRRGYTARPLSSNLNAAFRLLNPLAAYPTRHLLLRTVSGGTAYFNNHLMMQGDYALAGEVSGELKTRAVAVVNQEETVRKTASGQWRGEWGVRRFIVYENGELVRAVHCYHGDDGWEFGEEGKPLPFEDVERYKAKRKRERLTSEMVEAYLGALGLWPFEDSFYIISKQRPALLIERGDETRAGRAGMIYRPLKEVRDMEWTEDEN